MSSSWTRAFGLSMTVCLLAIMAAPALAADPAHARPAFTVPRGTGKAGVAARGMHLLASLQVMGVPVVGPVALLSYAEHAIQRLIFPSSTGRKLTGNLTWRTGSQVFNESALPQHLVLPGQTGAGALGFAENLTAYLGGKGYEVTDLDAALSGARTALAGSNMTAFRIAMMSFRKDLDAKIVAGAINRTVIGDFLRTIHPLDSAGPGQEPYGRGLRIPAPCGR